MKRRTSTNIAIKFTLYVMVLFLLIGTTMNIGFFFQRNQGEMNRLETNRINNKPGKILKETQEKVIIINNTPELIREIKENTIIRNIAKIDDTYIMYSIKAKTIKIIEVRRPIEMQINLFRLSIIIISLWTILTFLLSRLFVKSSLHQINELVYYVQKLDINKLDTQVPLSWPEDDEIRIIAQTLQSSLDIIKTQADSLKDFVSYASHELKTPLATIRWFIDLGIKKNYDMKEIGPKIKNTLTEMNDLLDSLVQITKREFTSIHNEETDIVPLIKNIISSLSKQFENKSITLTQSLPEKSTVSGKSEIITIIISNLLHNAYKFTHEQWAITISLKNNILSITDTGKGIAQEDQQKIWTRFWKKNEESTEWYGLWLYMVKLLIEKLGRTIALESNQNSWTTFTITIE